MLPEPLTWKDRAVLALAALLGVALRVKYVLVTPPLVRGHDVQDHLAYIASVARTFRIPPWNGGIEFFHPPLYYYLSAVVVRLALALHVPAARVVACLQGTSAVLSCLALAAALWIGRELFPSREEAVPRAAFWLLAAVFPDLIVDSASRIGNDALAQPVSFLCVALLLLWWRTGSRSHLALLGAALGLAALVKSNTLLLAAAAALLVLLRSGGEPRAKLKELAVVCGLPLLLCGWFYAARLADGQPGLTGRIDTVWPGLRVPNAPSEYLTFNPAAVVARPFNDPWPSNPRRALFWEFLFKSALFGEYDFGARLVPFGRVLVVLELVLLPVFLFGAARAALRAASRTLPMLLLLGLSLAALLAVRVRYPFSTQQEVRFVPWILLAVSFFTVSGAEALRPRALFRGLIGAFALAAIAFFVAL